MGKESRGGYTDKQREIDELRYRLTRQYGASIARPCISFLYENGGVFAQQALAEALIAKENGTPAQAMVARMFTLEFPILADRAMSEIYGIDPISSLQG